MHKGSGKWLFILGVGLAACISQSPPLTSSHTGSPSQVHIAGEGSQRRTLPDENPFQIKEVAPSKDFKTQSMLNLAQAAFDAKNLSYSVSYGGYAHNAPRYQPNITKLFLAVVDRKNILDPTTNQTKSQEVVSVIAGDTSINYFGLNFSMTGYFDFVEAVGTTVNYTLNTQKTNSYPYNGIGVHSIVIEEGIPCLYYQRYYSSSLRTPPVKGSLHITRDPAIDNYNAIPATAYINMSMSGIGLEHNYCPNYDGPGATLSASASYEFDITLAAQIKCFKDESPDSPIWYYNTLASLPLRYKLDESGFACQQCRTGGTRDPHDPRKCVGEEPEPTPTPSQANVSYIYGHAVGDASCVETTRADGSVRKSCFTCPPGKRILFSDGKATACNTQIITDTQRADFGPGAVYDQQIHYFGCYQGN